MKAITITQMILRVSGLLVLILGICFWAGWVQATMAMQGIHELLGIIVVISLWVLGLAQGRLKGGSLGLAIGTFVIGLVVAIFGLSQEHFKTSASIIPVINTIHLLLGLLAIGFGEMVGARGRRLAKA